MNANQNKHFLAMAEGECPEKWYYEERLSLNPHSPRCQCKGTGRVYLLDVREPCERCNGKGEIATAPGERDPQYHQARLCHVCHGLGFQPTENAWKWLEAALNLNRSQPLHLARYRSGKFLAEVWIPGIPTGKGDTLHEAFFAALVSAIKPLMVNDPEAWVLSNIKGE